MTRKQRKSLKRARVYKPGKTYTIGNAGVVRPGLPNNTTKAAGTLAAFKAYCEIVVNDREQL